jgi:hypothetical protein
MRKVLASSTVLFLMLGASALRAQDQPQDPQVAQDSQATSTVQPGDPQADNAQSNDVQPGDAQQGADPAAPGVARVSYISGNASSQRGDNGEWVALTVNAPLEPGDRISTGQGSRAEVQLDGTDVLRLSENSTAKIVSINRNQIQIQVGSGLVTYSVLRGGEAIAEIDTPNVAVHPSSEGDYRILVNSDAESIVTIRSGSADITTPQGSTHVETGQMITIDGTDAPQYKTTTASVRDDWDNWNNQRDGRISNAQSWGNTNRHYTGTEDLDGHGVWTEVPDYGRVWQPSVGADWAPYRDGRWVYEPYYGWTWVSNESWGWAPYHYGRWFAYNGGWAWWPGPVYAGYYPLWAPAYVSFFGWGGGGFGIGVGFGFGWGHVGWLPIGPGDWYHPWFGRWGAGGGVLAFNRFNSFHDGFGPLGRASWHQYSNFNGALRDDHIRSGVSSMAGSEFGHGAVPAHQERVSESTLRESNMSTGRMPVSPTHASYSPSGRAANPSTIRNAPSSSQHFFSASRANSPANGSTSRMAGANGGAGVGARDSARTPSQPAAENRSSTNASRGSVNSARPGWQSFSPPASNRSGQSATTGNANPYQRSNSNPSQGSRAGNSNSYNRPALNMRQPIVTPRGGSSYGYNAPRGNSPTSRSSGAYGPYAAPRSSTAPRGNTAPRANTAPRSTPAPRTNTGGSHASSGASHAGGGSHGGGGHSGGHH